MATQVQFRGGTTAQTNAATGAVREVSVDTDKKVVVVHDGATAGGFPSNRFPKYTSAQRDALTPVDGDMIYNTDTHRPEFYDGITWISL